MNVNPVVIDVLTVLVAYLIGSISFAIVVSRLRGLNDPRAYGSGNPGATNVLRSGDKTAALLTLLGDALKGVVAVLLARAVLPHWLPMASVETGVAWAGLAAFLGHLFPIFHRFQGGKGVATAAGVMLALSPVLGSLTLLTWIAVAVLSRYSSLAALTAAALSPVYDALWSGPTLRTGLVAVIAVLLIARHRSNISKLLAGTESKIGGRSSSQ